MTTKVINSEFIDIRFFWKFGTVSVTMMITAQGIYKIKCTASSI